MKKIINGKIYNTETAERLGSHCNSYDIGDFNRYEESLYRTKKGAFFLHGEGGPNTCYAKHFGNSRSGGENVEMMTVEEARKWAEEFLSVGEVEGIFGDYEEA